MRNFTPQRMARIGACRADLLESGFDLDAMEEAQRAAFVRENLEYFQCMLGDDSTHKQILSLLRRRKPAAAARRLRGGIAAPPRQQRVAGPAEAAAYVDPRAARIERRRQAMAHMTLDELVSAIGELRRQAADMAEQIQLVMERLRAMHVA